MSRVVKFTAVKPCCKVCKDAGKSAQEYGSHWPKDKDGVTVCPTLLSQQCRYCEDFGHTVKYCTVLARSNADAAKRHASKERLKRIQAHEESQSSKKPVAFERITGRFAMLMDDDSSDESPRSPKRTQKKAPAQPKEEFPALGGTWARRLTVAPEVAKKVSFMEMAVKPKEVENHLGELDYSADVPNQRLPDVDLAEVFGVQKGTADYEALNPTSAQQVMVEKTASAVDTSRYAVDNAASMLAEAGETFYKLVKVAHLDEGYGILQVAKAISTIVDDQTFARDVMQKVAERLEKEGVKFNERVELQKVAHPLVVNHQHPIMQAAANLERAAFAHYSADDAHEKLAAAHRLASKTLRDKMRKR